MSCRCWIVFLTIWFHNSIWNLLLHKKILAYTVLSTVFFFDILFVPFPKLDILFSHKIAAYVGLSISAQCYYSMFDDVNFYLLWIRPTCCSAYSISVVLDWARSYPIGSVNRYVGFGGDQETRCRLYICVCAVIGCKLSYF